MQNTIVRAFENDDRVVTILFNESGVFDEDWGWLRTFWDNYFLRGGVVQGSMWEEGGFYKQPDTNLPFGRGFIVGPDGRIAVPYFGHRPTFVTDSINRLLETSDVPGAPAAAPGIRLTRGRPNPFLGTTTLSLVVPEDSVARVTVHDVAGRRVAVLLDGRLPAGRHALAWDGTDAGGRPVSAGVYFVRAETPSGTVGRRVVRLR